MDGTLHWWAALMGLALAIVLILRKLNATYALLLGAIVGCLLGGASFADTVNIVVSGSQSVMGTVLRVLAAGVLAGVMMESGAAERISRAIVNTMGDKLAIFALAFATMIICAIGVFIPVAVLIVAPIAIEVGSKLHISKLALLVALSGGGKAGNIISPNPNAIAAASGFHVDLADVMVGSFVPALCGLAMAVLLASVMQHRSTPVSMADLDAQEKAELAESDLPSLWSALVAPVTAVVLLMLGPIGSMTHVAWLEHLQIDALYILPFAAIVGLLAMRKGSHVLEYTKSGLGRMVDVVMILIGAGTIGGLISASDLPQRIVDLINMMGVPGSLLAPISGILMAAATASTSTGVILAAGSFGDTILSFGTAPAAAAITMQAGATVIDALPQGNYFHVTAKSMNMTIGERMKVVPFEAAVGLTMTVVATLLTIVW